MIFDLKICALTTKDNPNDYFNNFDEWYSYEVLTGGRVLSALGDRVFTSDSLSYEENAREVERAIDDILKYDVVGGFVKVTKEVPDP